MTANKSPAEILKELIEQLDRRVFPENVTDVRIYSPDSGIKAPPGQPFVTCCLTRAWATDRRRLAKKPFGFLLRLLFYWLERCYGSKKIIFNCFIKWWLGKCLFLFNCRQMIVRDFYLIYGENINRWFDQNDRFSSTLLMSIAAHEVRHRLQILRPRKISYGPLSKLLKVFWANRELGISKRRYLALMMDYPVLCFSRVGRERDCQFIEGMIKCCSVNDWDWNKIVKIVTM